MRLLATVGVTLLAGLGIFAIGFLAGQDRATARQAAQEASMQALADKAAEGAARRVAAARVTAETISGLVREALRENPLYRDCELPGDMQRLLEAARQGSAEPRPDRGSVPAIGQGAP